MRLPEVCAMSAVKGSAFYSVAGCAIGPERADPHLRDGSKWAITVGGLFLKPRINDLRSSRHRMDETA